ncbi:hypothetical protein MBLNU230_g0544t1 [Neophaeotheca triangularis]
MHPWIPADHFTLPSLTNGNNDLANYELRAARKLLAEDPNFDLPFLDLADDLYGEYPSSLSSTPSMCNSPGEFDAARHGDADADHQGDADAGDMDVETPPSCGQPEPEELEWDGPTFPPNAAQSRIFGTEDVTGLNTDGIKGWPISPLFARDRWGSNIDYNLVEKGCMLASAFLEGTTAAFTFLHAMMDPYYPDVPDSPYNHLYPLPEGILHPQPRYQNPHAEPRLADWVKVHRTIALIAPEITIGFAEHAGCLAMTTVDGNRRIKIDPNGAYYPANGYGSHITLRPALYEMLTNLATHRFLNPNSNYNTPLDVVLTWNVAESLLHEIAHALHYAIRSRQPEPFYTSRGRVAELGFELQQLLVGGDYRTDNLWQTHSVYYVTHTSRGTPFPGPAAVDISENPHGILMLAPWPEPSMLDQYKLEGASEGSGLENQLRTRGEPLPDDEVSQRVPLSWLAMFMTGEFWQSMPQLKDRTPEKFHYVAGPKLVKRWRETGEGRDGKKRARVYDVVFLQ